MLTDLIEALTIFSKYKNHESPTHCEHDTLMVVGIRQNDVNEADTSRLYQLGFHWSDSDDCWISFRYGSA